jgi:hypothetical protein
LPPVDDDDDDTRKATALRFSKRVLEMRVQLTPPSIVVIIVPVLPTAKPRALLW